MNFRSPLPELLGRDSQRAVEFAGGVFPGDCHGQLDDLVVVVVLLQLGEEGVVDILIAQRDRVGVLEGNPFGGGEMRGFCIGFEREDFFVGDAQSAAHGSVDVLSKDATVERGDAAVDQAP